MKIKKGDEVMVIKGDDRGRRGTVREVITKKNRVIVTGVNIMKKHQRAMSTKGRGEVQGGIIELEAPIPVSNVMLICPICKQKTRIGYDVLESGDKVRVCRKCGATIG